MPRESGFITHSLTRLLPSCRWVHDGTKMVLQNISYVPGLYKIFDEILVNAADNKVRDATMDTIKIDIDVVSMGVFSMHALPREMLPSKTTLEPVNHLA